MYTVPKIDNIIVLDVSEVQKNQSWKWHARGKNGKPRGQTAGPRWGRGEKIPVSYRKNKF